MQVECGTFHTIALTKLGDIYTFGFNGNGRLGLADAKGLTDTRQRNVPTLIVSFSNKGRREQEDSDIKMDGVKASLPPQLGLACSP